MCDCVFKIIPMQLSICLVLHMLMIDKSLSTRKKKIKAFTVTEEFLLQVNSSIVVLTISSSTPGTHFFKSKNIGNKSCSDFCNYYF